MILACALVITLWNVGANPSGTAVAVNINIAPSLGLLPNSTVLLMSLSIRPLLLVSALWLLGASWAHADIYNCRTEGGQLSIQDRPCQRGSKMLQVYRDAPQRPARRNRAASSSGSAEDAAVGRASAPASAPNGGGGVPVGLRNQKNKTVICGLLAIEKQEAEAQIAGRSTALAGENPQDNLLKIERQRARVACDS